MKGRDCGQENGWGGETPGYFPSFRSIVPQKFAREKKLFTNGCSPGKCGTKGEVGEGNAWGGGEEH